MVKVKKYNQIYNKVIIKNYNWFGEIILKIKKSKTIFNLNKNNKFIKALKKLINNFKEVFRLKQYLLWKI